MRERANVESGPWRYSVDYESNLPRLEGESMPCGDGQPSQIEKPEQPKE